MGDTGAFTQAVAQLLDVCVREGLLNDQFLQLMQLQDESNPDFVSEVVHLYFEEGSSKLDRLSTVLADPGGVNFGEFDALVHQFKGSSASFGAQQMAALCVRLREACAAQHAPACAALVAELRQHFEVLNVRLQQFLELERQRKAAGGQ